MDLQNIPSYVVFIALCAGLFIFAVFLLGAIILPLVGIVVWSKTEAKRANALRVAAQSWPSTTGRVIKSRVEVSGGNTTHVSLNIVYRYNVWGVDYQSEQVLVGDKILSGYTNDEMYDLVDKYPVGSEVTVYYDPQNPTEAGLVR